MTDLAISFDLDDNVFAFTASTASGDLATDDGLRAAVLYSLFTDARAAADDEIPDGSTDRRGHWGDAYIDGAPHDSEGSKLWLLVREKQTQQTLQRAIAYAKTALQWLIDDAIATAVDVVGEWQDLGLLALQITITVSDGSRFADTFTMPVGA